MTVAESSAMIVQLPARPLTLDDVAVLAAADDVHRYELQEGNLVIMPPADTDHAALITRLLVWFVAAGHSPDTVLATPGLQITRGSGGRSPDLVVLHRPIPPTVWIDPAEVLLAVEVVSPGSEDLDRKVKPDEYARAGVPRFWRVERDGQAATVHLFTLGTDDRGEPAYVDHHSEPLTELLAGTPPTLT